MPIPTRAERLDKALEALLSGGRSTVPPDLRPLLETASQVRAALPALPVAARFEARLAARLGHRGGTLSAVTAIGLMAWWQLRHPSRLLVTGAASSAAVGASLTALLIWRALRRSSRSASVAEQ